METECKGQDEEDDDDGQLEKGLEDVGDHEDVDAQEGEHLHVGQEEDPGHRDGEGADLPLPPVPQPGLRVALVEVHHEDDGQHARPELDDVLPVLEVGRPALAELNQLLQPRLPDGKI